MIILIRAWKLYRWHAVHLIILSNPLFRSLCSKPLLAMSSDRNQEAMATDESTESASGTLLYDFFMHRLIHVCRYAVM